MHIVKKAKKRYRISREKGFTLIELLVAIAIIGMLSSVAITSLNGARKKAWDARRLSYIAGIQKALEMYKVDHGRYPDEDSVNSDWEMSWEDGADFLTILETEGYFPNGVPLDPVNSTGSYYGYYLYPAGSSGCNASKGEFYVLVIRNMDTILTRPNPQTPGWDCPNRHDWITSYDWVVGSFTN